MRKSRFKVRKQRRNHNYFFLLLFILIIPLTAIFIGSRITERIVLPVLYSDVTLDDEDLGEILNEGISTEQEQPLEETIDVEEENVEENKRLVEGEKHGHTKTLPLSVYLVQIASVSDTANIEGLIAELNKKELPNLIYKIDNAYKVYTFGLTNRILVESQLTNIRDHYPDAYISEMLLPGKQVSYREEEEALVESIVKDLNSIIESMEKQSEEWYNFLEKEGDLGVYKELLQEQEEVMTSLTETIADKDLPEDLPEKKTIEKMIYHHESNIQRSKELIEDTEEYHRIHSLFLDSLFRILEIIK